MKMPRTAATLFFCLSALTAQAADMIDPSRIISAATGDWDKDGSPDLALLAEPPEGSEDSHGIYIYLKGETNRLQLKTFAPDKVWGSVTTYGQEPFIEALPNGSILIASHNDAIGRNRWEQKLTIAYRNFDFVVAGYTYTSYDTLDLDNTTNCDFNVLTGKGKLDDKPVAVAGAMIFLKDWDDETGQKVCRAQ